jgi:hypothetical protein
VRILQREKKTLQTRIGLVLVLRLPLHRREATENVPLRVLDERESVRVAVAAPVKVGRAEAVATAA